MQSGRCALMPRQLRRATIWTAGRNATYYEQKRESGCRLAAVLQAERALGWRRWGY